MAGGAARVRSPSSRARNVSHVTNKDSDMDNLQPRHQLTGTTYKEARKGKKNEPRVREKGTATKKKIKSETPNVASRN